MNAVKHSDCWGVPARPSAPQSFAQGLAVALSARTPRSFVAAGYPLQSLTRKATISVMLVLAAAELSAYVSNHNTFGAMGMSYILVTDTPTTCNGKFPHQLGYFFEAIGGYEEKSEVAQVSEILTVDLSTFQHYDYGEEDPAIERTFWKDIGQYEQVIHTLIDSIKAHPDYHSRVIYNEKPWPGITIPMGQINASDLDSLKNLRAEYQNHPTALYPADSGYLREGRILGDLENLLNTLACFKDQGVKQLKLLYM